ncbi:hypothetical protein D9611_006535 [Ephemerocybe angulata]|uniref:Uncharacterized protein n=1 Tax=Ephemerocybe angulata TaxID=980116 RepID=A0A8H5FHA6_9AGAR|nr:hypothetical protein D9611_006535 [Tulosesus angulatus]
MSSLNKVLPAIGLISAALNNYNPFPYNPGFDIQKVTQLAIDLPSHSWEFGAAAEAMLELYTPQFSVFGPAPFPVAVIPEKSNKALEYVAKNANLGDGTYDALDAGNGAAGDPASMGVMAVMLGKTEPKFADAANRTVDGLLNVVPRFSNGAISHRAAIPELWADFMYMVPPFLAYYAADKSDEDLLKETVKQCGLYRDILQTDTKESYKGAWRHIIGPQSQDTGLWASGNGWAAAGMTRVLATVLKAPVAEGKAWQKDAAAQLTGYIKEILDGAMGSQKDQDLLRNYFQDIDGPHGFGEISGSSLLAAVAYRMAVIAPSTFTTKYITFADDLRKALGGNDKDGNPHITSTGVATPAVNPLWWLDEKPFTAGSPEGQAFVVLMYAAYRDCINAGICPKPSKEGSGATADRRSILKGHQRRATHQSV